jgi:hypothetical protein
MMISEELVESESKIEREQELDQEWKLDWERKLDQEREFARGSGSLCKMVRSSRNSSSKVERDDVGNIGKGGSM